MPIVVKNWLDRLVITNPNKSIVNLIGKLMDQVNDYRVLSTDDIDAVGMWLLKTDSNTDAAIKYLVNKKVK